MTDPLVDVAVRVYDDVADHATLAEVLTVVGQCRTDLTPPARPRYLSWSSDWPGSGSPITPPCTPPRMDRFLNPPRRA